MELELKYGDSSFSLELPEGSGDASASAPSGVRDEEHDERGRTASHRVRALATAEGGDACRAGGGAGVHGGPFVGKGRRSVRPWSAM